MPKNFRIWKTIKLGTPGLKTADDFRKVIESDKIHIDKRADDILGRPEFTVAAEQTEVDLVIVSVAELGFKKRTKREDVYAQAKKLGLQLCTPEVGPQLRLQYTDQPDNDWLTIAMEPIEGSDGSLGVFGVECSGFDNCLGRYETFSGGRSDNRHFFALNRRFVFIFPRQ
jgi:hypothetical protein